VPPFKRDRFVQDYDPADAKTHKGLDLYRMTMADLYKVNGLDNDIVLNNGVACFKGLLSDIFFTADIAHALLFAHLLVSCSITWSNLSKY